MGLGKMKHLLALLFVCSMSLGAVACSKSHSSIGDPDGGDASTDTDTDSDTDTDTDTDTGEEWCPELSTSCEPPDALDACGDDTLNEPRLIFPLSGRHIRDRRPRIIWEQATGVTQYRLEIALDRAFTDVVYRSTDYQPLGTDRFEHIVQCDLDCGVHFFRVKSVTAPECETGASSYTWEMFVGMAPGDLDRDGVPDIMYWKLIEPGGEFDPYLVQGWAFFELDEKGGQVADAEKVVEFEVEGVEVDFGASSFVGDTNGDGFADISIGYGTASSLNIYYYIFSGFKSGNVVDDDDAITVFCNNGETGFYIHPLSNRYSDVNGDGLSDFVVSWWGDFSNDTFTETLLVFFSDPSNDQILYMESADVVIPCPAGCVPTTASTPTSFGSYSSMADYNGDGLADIATELRFYSSGIADAGFYHSAVIFGGEDLPSEIDVLTEGVIVSSTQNSIISGDWDLGNSHYRGMAYIIGDVDFDGYPELGSFLTDAFDTTQSPLVETGGWVVFDDFFGPGQHLLPDVMDTVIVADFDTYADPTDAETIWRIVSFGDNSGDDIDDLIIGTTIDGSGMPNYPGRYFRFVGHEDWDDFIFLSTNTDNEIIDVEKAIKWLVPDIDGDDIADFISGDLKIWLSASGENVELNIDYSGAATGTEIVVPSIY